MKLVVSRTSLRTNARIHARSNAGEIDCTGIPGSGPGVGARVRGSGGPGARGSGGPGGDRSTV